MPKALGFKSADDATAHGFVRYVLSRLGGGGVSLSLLHGDPMSNAHAEHMLLRFGSGDNNFLDMNDRQGNYVDSHAGGTVDSGLDFLKHGGYYRRAA